MTRELGGAESEPVLVVVFIKAVGSLAIFKFFTGFLKSVLMRLWMDLKQCLRPLFILDFELYHLVE